MNLHNLSTITQNEYQPELALDKDALYSIMHHAMKKTQIYLYQDQIASLKHLALTQQTSYAELVRKAVSDYLAKVETKSDKAFNWIEHAKKISVPMGGISQRIDEELYQ